MTPERVHGVVLAGGASTRFGGDKLAATLDGLPLLHHALLAIASVADAVVLVMAPDAPGAALPPALGGRVILARDPIAFAGPLAGLAAGLQALGTSPAGAGPRDAVLVAAGDMPWLAPSVLRLLVERLGDDAGLDAITLGGAAEAPLPLAMRLGAATAVDEALRDGRRSLRAFLASAPATVVPEEAWRALDPAGLTQRDVDTPADLRTP